MKSYRISVSKVSVACVRHSDVADSAQAARVHNAIARAYAPHSAFPSFAHIVNEQCVRFWADFSDDVDRDLASLQHTLRQLTQPSKAGHG